MIKHCTIGAERAGKHVQDLDLSARIVFLVADDGAVAKDAARSTVGLYASAMPHEQLRPDSVDPAEVALIIEAIGAGDMAKSIEVTTPDLAERLSEAGTQRRSSRGCGTSATAGVNQLILTITDKALAKALMEREIERVPDVNTQLQLVHDRVMPAFALTGLVGPCSVVQEAAGMRAEARRGGLAHLATAQSRDSAGSSLIAFRAARSSFSRCQAR